MVRSGMNYATVIFLAVLLVAGAADPVLRIFTTASEFPNNRRAGVCRLLESAVQNRVPIEVICFGTAWVAPGTKLDCLLARLLQADIAPDTLVLFVDAYDVVSTPTVVLSRLSLTPLLLAAGCRAACGGHHCKVQPVWTGYRCGR